MTHTQTANIQKNTSNIILNKHETEQNQTAHMQQTQSQNIHLNNNKKTRIISNSNNTKQNTGNELIPK